MEKRKIFLHGGVILRSPSKQSIKFLKEALWEVVESALENGRGRLDSDKWLEEDTIKYREVFEESVKKLIQRVKEVCEKRIHKDYS